MAIKRIITRLYFAMWISGSILHAADAQLDVSANRNTIYIGESVLLNVKVTGIDNPQATPDLSAITNCAIKMLGSHSDSRFSVVIVNGQMTREGYTGRVYTYELTPASTGLLKAGPVRLSIDGKILTSEGPSIQVTGVEKQDWVNIDITASRESVLVDEAFDITLRIHLKRLAGKFADIEPLDPRDPPVLSVPFLETTPLSGLDIPDISQLLRNHLVQRNDAPGFAINNYTIRNDPFDFNSMFNFGGMMEERKAKFTFDKVITDKNGVSYFEYTLKLSYSPKEEGSHTFGPAIFKGQVVVDVNQSNNGIKKALFAVGPACVVRVVPPPEEGRPASYVGVIGSNLTAEASIDTQTCKVGDPLKLTLEISGNTRVDNITPPSLSSQDNLTKHFKIYEDTVQAAVKEGKKRFTYTIRPTVSGTIELPPIEISYFDSISRSYKTIKTQPIPVRANESQEIGADSIIGTATNRPAGSEKTSERDGTIVAPIDMDPSGCAPAIITLNKWEIAVLLIPPLAYFLALSGIFLSKHIKRDKEPRRRRQGITEAISSLHTLETSSKTGNHEATVLLTAIRKYIANRVGVPETGLTPSDARKLLKSKVSDVETVNMLCIIFENYFNAAYSYNAQKIGLNINEDSRKALELIEKVGSEIDSSSPITSANSGFITTDILTVVLAIFCLTPIISSALADNPVEYQFLWNEANSRMASASSPEEFLGTATVYQKLVDAGVRNGPVFFNMGTALLLGKQYDQALHALLRAERYSGSNSDIKHNMLLAIAGREKIPDPSLPWYRIPLFWHYQLSIFTRISITVMAFAGFWLALLLRTAGSTRIYKPLLSTSIILLIMVGSSALTSVQLEKKDIASNIRILVEPGTGQQADNSVTTNSLATHLKDMKQ